MRVLVLFTVILVACLPAENSDVRGIGAGVGSGAPACACSPVTPSAVPMAAVTVLPVGRLNVRYESRDGVNVVIRPIGDVVLDVAGAMSVLHQGGPVTLDPRASLAVDKLAASSMYYLYASAMGGEVTFSASTSAPDDALVYDGGSQEHRFAGVFFTDVGSTILPFSCLDGRYRYTSVEQYVQIGPTALKIARLAGNVAATVAIPAVPNFAGNAVIRVVASGTTSMDIDVLQPSVSAAGYDFASGRSEHWNLTASGAPVAGLSHDVSFDYPIFDGETSLNYYAFNYFTGSAYLLTAGFDY